jgi:hypothetical protein
MAALALQSIAGYFIYVVIALWYVVGHGIDTL